MVLPDGLSQFLPDGARLVPADMVALQEAMGVLPAEAQAGGKRQSLE